MSSETTFINDEISFDFTKSKPSVMKKGWGYVNLNGIYSIGTESFIEIMSIPAGDYLLEIELWPFFRDLRSHQSLRVLIGEQDLGEVEVIGWSTLGYEISARMIPAEGPLVMRFRHPDAARPADLQPPSADKRLLSVSFVALRLTPLTSEPRKRARAPTQAESSRSLPSRFESLGNNCEFGLVQRQLGHEHVGLFKFSGVPLFQVLLALRNGFEDIERITRDMVVLESPEEDAEYMVIGGRYQFRYHTNVFRSRPVEGRPDEVDVLIPIFQKKLVFEKRKMLSDLKDGQKIFVFRDHEVTRLEYVMPLWHALNRYGPNRLLWVLPVDDPSAVGTIHEIKPGFVCGYIDRFSPAGDPSDFSFDVWVRICEQAVALLDEVATT